MSGLLNDTSSSPLVLLLVFGTFAVMIAVPVYRTTWRPVVATPLRARRACGQIVDCGARIYWEHRAVLLPIGLVAVPLGSAAVLAQAALFHQTGLRRTFDALEDDKVEGFVALVIGGLTHGLAPILVGAGVTLVLRDVDQGGTLHLRAIREGLKGELWRLVGLGLAGILVVFLLALTIIGLPWAVKKAVDWAFVQQTAAFDGARGREAFRASRRLVRGHWLRVAATAFVLLSLLALTGPFFGIVVILLWDSPLATINLFASLLYALVLPLVSVAITLLYLDLAVPRDSGRASTGMLPAS